MKLFVNGEPRDADADTVEALFAIEAQEAGMGSAQGIAIALNGRVLRRKDWAETSIAPGDRIEIVRAMQGG